MAIKEGKFDAVFLAIGAHLGKRIDIPGPDTGRIIDALGFLKGMEGKRFQRLVDGWWSMEEGILPLMLRERPSGWVQRKPADLSA